ncbi:GNAT family N-acetyltransferase [Arthrobacter sp. NQ7]|uniref:ATP-binding protein n=1 Tax=Arthrobacter sp. NQ7 TaxID=3032303 RepID=UPI00240FA06C|nr:GNAT family N-acetyltransferase [Arthrobacter sp. NQ7]MDJ0459840.1 GNAT family N-acetyltransferase [Arthrobacter sp. NQ7]
MPSWRIRDFHTDDVDRMVRLWEQNSDTGDNPVYSLSEILRSCADGVALLAIVDNAVVGAVAAQINGDRATVTMLALLKNWRGQGLGSSLLSELDKRLVGKGIFQVSALLPPGETGVQAYKNSGYETRDLVYFERTMPMKPREAAHLEDLGGRFLPRGLWDGLAGMVKEKEIIERRLVLPLAQPDVAHRFAVSPPKSVVLFGPPGTGKTTFAKAVASRLGWPFIELSLSGLAAEGVGLAAGLRSAFHDIRDLERVVVFIDEVEEIASRRGAGAPTPQHGVTNELLKIIPAFREQENRLLVCATNFVRTLDKAFLRHGRFDYVIPIGVPDQNARQAIWSRYLPAETLSTIDIQALVERSERFTPADIEFTARQASQRALERAIYAEAESGDTWTNGPGTEDYLAAISETRTTITQAALDEFEEDIASIARY